MHSYRGRLNARTYKCLRGQGSKRTKESPLQIKASQQNSPVIEIVIEGCGRRQLLASALGYLRHGRPLSWRRLSIVQAGMASHPELAMTCHHSGHAV